MVEKYHEIEIRTYDVWGNEEEGYEVNNVHKLDTGELFISDSVWQSDEEMIKLIRKELQIEDRVSDSGFEFDGDDNIMYVTHESYPVCEVAIIKTIVDMSLANV